MSRKTSRNRSKQEHGAEKALHGGGISRTVVITSSVVAVLLAIVAWALLHGSDDKPDPAAAGATAREALASNHSPAQGDVNARVHIVEFLDPACETCAMFFPLVKQLMAENPGRIRLSVRHVPFHDGSDYVVRLLEASRRQDRYWQTLEALLESQHRWVQHHTVLPDLVAPAIAGVGLNLEQLAIDMTAPEIAQRMKRDLDAGVALKVTATPEYFVNGRPLPSFGLDQLQALVYDELRKAY